MIKRNIKRAAISLALSVMLIGQSLLVPGSSQDVNSQNAAVIEAAELCEAADLGEAAEDSAVEAAEATEAAEDSAVEATEATEAAEDSAVEAVDLDETYSVSGALSTENGTTESGTDNEIYFEKIEGVTFEETGYYENPDLSDVNDVDALSVISEGENEVVNEVFMATTVEKYYATSLDDAIRYVQDNMVGRSSEFAVALNAGTSAVGVADLSSYYAGLMSQSKKLYSDMVGHLYDERSGNPHYGDYLRLNVSRYTYATGYEVLGNDSKLVSEGKGKVGDSYCYVRFSPVYLSSAAEEAAVDARIAEILKEDEFRSISICSKGEMTDAEIIYEKSLAIYNYFLNNVSYITGNYSTYNALCEGKSVCQGISTGFYRLAYALGLDCCIITGTSRNVNHAWNIVKIGDIYYDMDATWGINGHSYDYLLKGSTNFDTSHTRNDKYLTTEFVSAHPVSATDYPECKYIKGILCNESAYALVDSLTDDNLQISKTLMEEAAVRAIELSKKYSKIRPNGEDISSVISNGYQVIALKSKEDYSSFLEEIIAADATNGMSTIGAACFNYSGKYYWAVLLSTNSVSEDEAALSDEIANKNDYVVRAVVSTTSGVKTTYSSDIRMHGFGTGSSLRAASVKNSDGTYKITPDFDNIYIDGVPSYYYNLTVKDADKLLNYDANESKVINVTVIATGKDKMTKSISEVFSFTIDGNPIDDISVMYTTHVQTYGWGAYVMDGIDSGTVGEAKRLEGIKIKLKNNSGSSLNNLGIQYTTHVQTYGWLPWCKDNEMSGTTGEAKRLEAIKIQLTGEAAAYYDVYYRVHAQSFGWLGWAKNGESAGTAGYAKRLEAINIVILPKGEVPASYNSKLAAYRSTTGSDVKVAGANNTNVMYRTQVQTYGWQAYKYNGSFSGTSGEGKRLEAIDIRMTNQQYSGNIEYKTHIQSIGWESAWRKNGEVSGTVGSAKRLEAIQIRLTGEMADKYDVYYRVYVQSFGWLGWAKNGESAGTEGLAKRLEGIQIVLKKKGESAPGSTSRAFVK